MPRDGSNIYHTPPGTPGITNTTIASTPYNGYLADIEQDLNTPRPIVAGGTGASNAADALTNLSGEMEGQIVTNYDSQVFVSGSFYSASGATNPPVAGHAFVGYCYSSDLLPTPPTAPLNQNMVIEARDQNDTVVPGLRYIREKKAGVWGPWKADVGSVAARSNVIINGDFRINQVGYVSAAVLSAGLYGHDQWKAGVSGGDYSFTQLKSSTQITIAAGKSLIQPIEDANIVGGSYVLSWSGTALARAGVNTLTPSGAYAASPLLISGQTAGTVMSVEFNTGTLGTVKLESGSIATPFIMRPYDQELLTCQRYYYRRDDGLKYIATLQAYSTTNAAGYMFGFPVTMRSSPAVLYSALGDFSLLDATGNPHVLTNVAFIPTADHVSANPCQAASGLVAGNASVLYGSTANASLKFDARL